MPRKLPKELKENAEKAKRGEPLWQDKKSKKRPKKQARKTK
jgi:hypothetical protein